MNTQDGKIAAASGQFVLGGDLPVYRLGFGAMRITGSGIWGEPADRAEAIRVLRRVLDLGINFIDTADSYGPEVSENLIAETLYPYPKDLVIATKGGFLRPGPDVWETDGRPEHLRSACEASLRRLRLDRIDLYQLHRIDSKVPAEDQIGTLKDLQSEGKIRHIGLSEVTVPQIQNALTMVPIVAVQNRYSIADQGSADVLDFCDRNGIAFIPWYPLAAGKFKSFDDAFARTAQKLGITVSQLALAWLLWRSPVMLPIPGTSSVAHLEENTAAALVKLDAAEMKQLAASANL